MWKRYLEGNICKCPLEKCLHCPPGAFNKGLCSEWNQKDNFYPIENNLNIGPYINCYKEPEGYYIDGNDSFY